MTQKRRNHGRSKHGRGHTERITCDGCRGLVAKDKAIKRFQVKGIVDAAGMRDLEENAALEEMMLPKTYIRYQYCVSCAVHRKIVRVRSKNQRKVRTFVRGAGRKYQK